MCSQNTVKYAIYCDKELNNWETFEEECNSLCQNLMVDYIWQKEKFILSSMEHQSALPCLCGSTDVGENINDEWFIVFMLFELTKQFNDIIVQVSDDDGEFLLIQAAEELPHWLKPHSSENRLFLHGGSVHIIPQPTNPAELQLYPTAIPTIAHAYKLILADVPTNATDSIQKLIFQRINGYPDKFHHEFHHAHCYIPEEIVYVLHKSPWLVANAVQAFYERDPMDANICQNLERLKPDNPMVASVRFTQHLYGQLNHAQIQPDRKSKWTLPSCHEKSYKAAYLGYKLTCGFEILLSSSALPTINETNYSEVSGRLWEQYLSNLKKNHFFKNELEGSQGYMKRLNEAKQHFKATCKSSTNLSSANEVGCEVDQLINESKEHTEDIRKACENIPEEDSDDWLTLTAEELDKMMLSMWGSAPSEQDNQGNVANLELLANSVKSFVDNVSSYEGAEEVADLGANNEDGDEIKFDANIFMDCVRNILDPSKHEGDSGNHSAGEEAYTDEDDDDNDDEFVSCFQEDGQQVDSEIALLMERMDMELKQTNVPKSFTNLNPAAEKDCTDDSDAPLNVDINLVHNFMQSFAGQDGLAGPVSSMLHSMGMNLPPPDGS